MAKVVVNSSDYIFNAAGQTVTFGANYTGLELSNIHLIANVTDNLVIYQFNKAGFGGTLAGLVLTLDYDTTSMSNTDVLKIIIEADFLTPSVSISDGSSVADVLPLAGSDALAVALVDSSGNQISSFGGGVQYTEGDTDATITGTALLWEDAADTLKTVSSADPLPVNVVSGSASTTEYTEDSVVPANPAGIATVVERDDQLATLTPVEGDWTHLRATDRGALWVALSDGAGNQITSVGGGTEYTEGDVDGTIRGTAILIEGAGDTLIPVPGSAADGILVNLGTNNDVTVTGTVAATQSGTWNINNISGTVSLPTGASTAANQSTIITALQLLDNVVATDGSAALTQLYQVGGTDGTNAQILSTNSSGHLNIADGGNSITVDGTVAISGTVPVSDAGGSLTVDGTVAATQSGVWSVGLSAGTNNIGDVDVLTVPAPLNLVGGGTEAAALRVTIANNSTGVLSVDDNGSTLSVDDGGASLTVDGTIAATQSGTWNVGLSTGTNNIGDVDVLTVPAPLSTTGGGTEATALRVTIANDSTGVVSIDDNGSSLTVDGSVSITGTPTVEIGATSLAALESITVQNGAGVSAVNIQDGGNSITVDGTVSVTDGGGSITVDGTVNIGAISPGTNYIGKVRLTDNVTDAEVVPLAGYNAQAVAVVDGSGNQITAFGGGIQYTEGDTDATITGTALLFETNTGTSALGVVSSVNPLPISDNGTTLSVDDGGSSLTIDGSVSITGTPTVEIGATSLTALENITVQNGAGASAVNIQDGGNSITVDGTVAATQSGTWNITNISGTVSLPTGAATSANQSTMITALQLLDNVVAVDGSAALTSLYQVGGTDGVNAQILSTNSSGHLNIADGGNSITVDGTVGISGTVPVSDGGGSLTIDGTIAATQSGTWNVGINAGTNNIGDVDVLTVPAPLSTTGGGTEAAALRVTLANDSTGVISVDDNGGSLTVDGSVSITGTPTVEIGATSLAALESITVQNGAGASAVNIQDGGNSITVDGTVTANAGTGFPTAALDGDAVAGVRGIPIMGRTTTTVELVSVDSNGYINTNAWQNGIWAARVADASGNTINSIVGGATRGLAVAVIDSTGAQLSSSAFKTTEYTEGDIDASLSGNVVLMEGAGNTTVPLQGTAADGLLVNLGANNDVSVSNTVSVSDGGGSLTVDGTVAVSSISAGTNYIGKVRLTDGTTDGEIVPLAGFNAQAVAIVDGAGAQITSFGGGTQYTEGDVDATITGTALLWEDAGDTLRAVSATNPLPVDVVSSVSWSVTEALSVTAHALGTSAYSGTTSIPDDYILSNVQFNFSTTQARDITITDADGTVIYETLGDTSLNLVLQDIDMAYDGGNNFTIDVTQTAGACAMDLTATVRQGTTALIGNADVDLHDGSGNAVTSHSAGGSRGIDVAIIDGSGNQITSFGGGTQYTQGDVDATITGTAMLMEAAGDTLQPVQGTVADGLLVNLGANNDVTITGSVTVADGGGSLTIDAVSLPLPTGASTEATLATVETNTDFGTVVGGGTETGALRVTIANNSTGVLSVDDNGSSLTVDGTVAATQSGSWVLGANSGIDIGDVTINNAAGASAVNIQDGGNSITVDGTVAATQSGSWIISANSGVDIGDVTINNAGGASAVNIQDGGNSITVDGTVTVTDGLNIEGDVAHDTADSGNPVKVGAKAIAHGTNPTAVAAGDRTDLYANRHGIPFFLGGHPNIITRSVHIGDADGAQTNASIVGTINAGTKVVVTAVAVTVDSATTATGGVAVKLGFGATTIPADSTTGANGVLLDHNGIAAGSGLVIGSGAGILGIGGDGEELRLTCEDPVGGSVCITFSYFTIES